MFHYCLVKNIIHDFITSNNLNISNQFDFDSSNNIWIWKLPSIKMSLFLTNRFQPRLDTRTARGFIATCPFWYMGICARMGGNDKFIEQIFEVLKAIKIGDIAEMWHKLFAFSC